MSEEVLDSGSFNKNYRVLKETADWLSKQEEPDIDQLVPKVERAMQAYRICKDRLDRQGRRSGSICSPSRPLRFRARLNTTVTGSYVFRGLISRVRMETATSHSFMKPRPLAVRPEELQAIRRASSSESSCRQPDQSSWRRLCQASENGLGLVDLNAPNGGYLT